MRWFKPNFAVCEKCGAHYEPVTGYEARWGHLCAIHRKPEMERDIRKDDVIAWASANWERLEDMYKKEFEEKKADYLAAQQARLESMMKYKQQAAMNAQSGSLNGPFGGLGWQSQFHSFK
jgi:hypothetical protein